MSEAVISSIQLLIDFGLVVLILMVQFTIYPSFLFFETDNLVKWHLSYTGQIAKVVGPLMLLQLGLSIYALFFNNSGYIEIIYLILVLGTWISTALQFVPIHNRISNNNHSTKDLDQLVKRNWLRVILWLLIFGLSLYQFRLEML